MPAERVTPVREALLSPEAERAARLVRAAEVVRVPEVLRAEEVRTELPEPLRETEAERLWEEERATPLRGCAAPPRREKFPSRCPSEEAREGSQR